MIVERRRNRNCTSIALRGVWWVARCVDGLHDDLRLMNGLGDQIVRQHKNTIQKNLVIHLHVLAQYGAVLQVGLKVTSRHKNC